MVLAPGTPVPPSPCCPVKLINGLGTASFPLLLAPKLPTNANEGERQQDVLDYGVTRGCKAPTWEEFVYARIITKPCIAVAFCTNTGCTGSETAHSHAA